MMRFETLKTKKIITESQFYIKDLILSHFSMQDYIGIVKAECVRHFVMIQREEGRTTFILWS
jgi:hypothetical protein